MAALLGMAMLLGAACNRPAPVAPDVAERPAQEQPEDLSPDEPALPAVAEAEADTDHVQVSGRALYLQHCAACHGDNGDGQGLATPFLFPKPRDLRAGRFRLVSTTNGVPTTEDLEAVLVRGMPGSSMPPWPHLSRQERQALVDEIIRLRLEGARQEILHVLIEQEQLEEDEIEEEEVQEFIQRRTTPGPVHEVPEIGPPDAAAIARGKEIYFKQSCHSCHGDEGKGDGQQKMVDDEGFPMRPRDLTQGIFKGGHDPKSLYWRLALGMPGTPMPSSRQLTSQQIIDLIHFTRSMSDEETRQAAILNRERLLVQAVDEIPEEPGAPLWDDIPPVRLHMLPLWWRDDADPGLEVQAAHDGQTVALRLRWRDEQPDLHAGRSEAFADAMAVQLYQGDAEPFLGMGTTSPSQVDVWFWNAARQHGQFTVEDQYPRTVVDIYPFHERQVDTAQYDRPGTRTEAQPEVSLPALASGNAIVPGSAASGGSSLVAGGPGTVTFRLPQSQLVTAHGQWDEGRWTVVMTRPLAVPSPADGVSLQPAGRASIAFAVWDGSHGDRNGQKLVTIWQDLIVETP